MAGASSTGGAGSGLSYTVGSAVGEPATAGRGRVALAGGVAFVALVGRAALAGCAALVALLALAARGAFAGSRGWSGVSSCVVIVAPSVSPA